MRDNFVFKGKVHKNEKNYFKDYYKSFTKLKEPLIALANDMYVATKDYELENQVCMIESDCNQSIELAKQIIYYYLKEDYLEYFNYLIIRDAINLYDSLDESLRLLYDNYLGPLCSSNYEDMYINIPLENELFDVFSIIHEFMHATNCQQNFKISYMYLSEVSSIFMEYLTTDYLKNNYPCNSAFYETHVNRIKSIDCFNKNVYNKSIDSDAIDMINFSLYNIGTVIASKLYQDYLQNKELTMNRFLKFNMTLGETSFNNSMRILGFNIRYKNNGVICSKELYKELIDSYLIYIKDINSLNQGKQYSKVR